VSQEETKKVPQKESFSQKVFRKLPSPAVELLTDAMELYDKRSELTRRDKLILAGVGVVLLVAIILNPSEESYRNYLNQEISRKLNTGDIKKRFFNKPLYATLIENVDKSIERTNLLFFSFYSASISIYNEEIPDLEASSIGFLEGFYRTDLMISSPLEESILPQRTEKYR
jgi:hypothetical protein